MGQTEKFRRKWNEAKWSEPLRVTSRTLHCVRLAGKGDTWYHLSSCVACDPPSRSLAQTAVNLRSQVQEREDAGCKSAGKLRTFGTLCKRRLCIWCRYPITFKDKYGVEKVKKQNKKPGECSVTQEEDGRTIFHLITKRKCTDLPTYGDFTNSLKHMRDWCVEHRVKSVSYPVWGVVWTN